MMSWSEAGLSQAPYAEIEFMKAEKTSLIDGWVTALGFGALIVYFLSSLSGGLPTLNGARWADTLSLWGEFKPALVSYTAVCGSTSDRGEAAGKPCPRDTKKALVSQSLFED
jgi:hypothetical protein